MRHYIKAELLYYKQNDFVILSRMVSDKNKVSIELNCNRKCNKV